MRFSTATTVTALALAGASVRAADYRQSIRAPANISMGLFEKAYVLRFMSAWLSC